MTEIKRWCVCRSTCGDVQAAYDAHDAVCKGLPEVRREMSCQECGMLLDDPAEFHPYVFCVIKKGGQDPWEALLWVNKRLGIDTTYWPERPPLVRDLKPPVGS